MITRHAFPEEKKRMDEMFSIAFEYPLADEPTKPMEDGVTYWAAFTDDGRMMSSLMVSDFLQNFDGSRCKMGGIGGVASLPTYRRQGGIRSCFEHALPEMYENNYDFSYLYPFSTAYYRKFGYENCVQRYQVTVNLGLLKPRPVAGSFLLAEPSDPMAGAVRSIDSVWEEHFNMMVLHDETHYDWIRNTDPAKKQEFTYVYFDREHSPKAYTTFRMQMQPDGRNLVCSRMAFLDREGWDGLMNLFKSLSADHALVKFQLPAVPAMQYLLPEWSMGAAGWEILPAGMVRVINVQQVLSKAAYRGNGEAVFSLTDPQIPQNSAVWRVVYQNGRAVTVEKTEQAPQAAMTIECFSALITGTLSFDEAAAWMPGLQVLTRDHRLDQVFYRKPLMIVDYF